MADGSLAAGVAMLRAAVDVLLEADMTGPCGVELAGLVAELEVQRCRLAAVDQVVIAQLEQCRLAGEFGRQSTADLLGELSRIAPGEAKARVRAAQDMGPRREFCGAPLARACQVLCVNGSSVHLFDLVRSAPEVGRGTGSRTG